MAIPTIEERLKKRFILMTHDEPLVEQILAITPADWEIVRTDSLDDLGEFQDVLLHRFLFLDLDDLDVFDPLDVIRQVRMEWMLNLPIFCFGGSPEERDEARLSRADRFFERDEVASKLPLFFDQYRW